MTTKKLCIEMPNPYVSFLAKAIGLEGIIFRRMVMRQLLSRTEDDFSSSWCKSDIDHRLVKDFCLHLKNELEWPNHFFFQNDPLWPFLIPKGLGMDDVDFLISCQKKYMCNEDRYNSFLDSISSITIREAICFFIQQAVHGDK